MRFISNLGWIQLYLLVWEELCVQVTIVTFMVGRFLEGEVLPGLYSYGLNLFTFVTSGFCLAC